MKILVTGGMGYIGSHACVALLDAGYDVVVVDNLSNSLANVASRIEQITRKKLDFINADIRHQTVLQSIFKQHQIEAVMHFAGLKAVGESVDQPLSYYENNVAGSLALLKAMLEADVKTIVFSSSATVYGEPATVPIMEDFPLSATNPYGESKLMIEKILRDLAKNDDTWRIALLRYFNPVGAHESGLIGENPLGVPNNLLPLIAQVADGSRDLLRIYGNDYPTVDGTGVRDYIHVVDLACAHIKALEKLVSQQGVLTYNIGTGHGTSVLEILHALCQKPIPYQFYARRPGDIAQCYADVSLAEHELAWRAKKGIAEMCADAWRWQSRGVRS